MTTRVVGDVAVRVGADVGPLLIGLAQFALAAAKGVNGFVQTAGDLFTALDELLDPMGRLEDASNEIVRAMADEIQQSQLLDAALERGGRMSEAAAKVKLDEAKARYENAKAAIAEQQAIARDSDVMKSVNEQIKGTQEALNALVAPGADDGLVPFKMREQVEELEQSLVDLYGRRDQLIRIPEELSEQFERTGSNVERLTALLAEAKNGMVGSGPSIDPITPGDDVENTGSTGQRSSVGEGRNLADVLTVTDEQIEELRTRNMSILELQREAYAQQLADLDEARKAGLITQEEYNKLELGLQSHQNEEMRKLRHEQASMALGAASELAEGLAQISGKGGEKILRASKAMSAAQALVDTYAGAAAALKLPFPQNFAAASAIIAKGASFIAAIKGASPGGGAVSGGSAGGGISGGGRDLRGRGLERGGRRGGGDAGQAGPFGRRHPGAAFRGPDRGRSAPDRPGAVRACGGQGRQ